MKIIMYLLFSLTVFFIISCNSISDTDDNVTGRILYSDGYTPAVNATVFWGETLQNSGHYFTQSACSGNQGYYSIKKPEGSCMVINFYAMKMKSGKKFISPILRIYADDFKGSPFLDDLVIFEEFYTSNVNGILIDDDWDSQVFDVSNNLVYLYRLDNCFYVKIDSTYSDSLGNFEFYDLSTSNYRINPQPVTGRFTNKAYIFVDGINDIDVTIVYGTQLP